MLVSKVSPYSAFWQSFSGPADRCNGVAATVSSFRLSNVVISRLARREWSEGATVRLEIKERRAVQTVKATHESVGTIDS